MLYHKNDLVHPLLTKAEKPSQARIDDLDAGARRPTLGNRSILDIPVQEALTDFSMGGRVQRTAWSLNPYTGCVHACSFCYVPETMHVERNRWGSYILAKRSLPRRLATEMNLKPKRTVYVSTGTDPYQSLEAELKITRACLERLAARDWPLEIITRSPLVVRDADLISRFSRAQVGLSVPTLDDEARRILEPAAPPIKARLDALRRLSGLGLRVYANYVPVYPPTNGFTLREVARAFQDAGVLWVNASAWSRQAGYLARLWDRYHGTEWEDLVRFIGSKTRQEELRAELGRELRAVGIPMRGGFFNKAFVPEPKTQPTRLPDAPSPTIDASGPLDPFRQFGPTLPLPL